MTRCEYWKQLLFLAAVLFGAALFRTLTNVPGAWEVLILELVGAGALIAGLVRVARIPAANRAHKAWNIACDAEREADLHAI